MVTSSGEEGASTRARSRAGASKRALFEGASKELGHGHLRNTSKVMILIARVAARIFSWPSVSSVACLEPSKHTMHHLFLVGSLKGGGSCVGIKN